MDRTKTLETAIGVTTDRNASYGTPEDCFSIIAQLWTTYLGQKVYTSDVANMMILLKVAREKNMHKDDNAIDIAGYAACLNELYNSESKSVEVSATELDKYII